MKKILLATLSILFFSTVTAGLTFANTADDTKEKKSVVQENNSASNEKLENKEEKKEKMTPEKVREIVEKTEKERCQ